MIVSQSTSSKAAEDEDQFEKDAKLTSNPRSSDEKKYVFSQQEIEDALISNALLLFFAGFEGASTGMVIE